MTNRHIRLPKAILAKKEQIAQHDADASATPTAVPQREPASPAPAVPTPQPSQPAPAAVDRTAELDEIRRREQAAANRAAQLELDNRQLRQQLEQATARPPEPVQPLDEARARDILGEDAFGVIREIVRAETAGVASKVQQHESVIAPLAQDANATLEQFQAAVQSKLGQHAQWFWLQSHPGFNSFMDTVVNGAPRGEALHAAIRARDVANTARLYAEFARSIGIQVQAQSDVPASGAPAAVTMVPLEQREAPSGASAATVTGGPPEHKVFTAKEVSDFYREKQRAQTDKRTWTPTVAADFEKREREIVEATKRGLIRR